jgi:SSS family solute:Na+ symporter
MTNLLLTAFAGLFAFGVYIAAVAARGARTPEEFLDAGRDLPAWTFVFAGAGVLVAGLGVADHLQLVGLYGLQASHLAVGLVLAALCGVLVQKRLWLAARILGAASPVELMGRYYASTGLRVLLIVLVGLFAVPVAASSAARLGQLVGDATGGAVPAPAAIWTCLFFLFLAAVIGGWRAIVYTIAMESFLLAVLLLLTAGTSWLTLERLTFFAGGLVVAPGNVADQIPGVVQFSRGIGKDVATGGVWTTVAIVSTALSLTGLVLNPIYGYVATTTTGRTGLAFGNVWSTAGLATGLLILLAPVLAAESGGTAPALTRLIDRLSSSDVLSGLALVLLLVVGQLVAVAFLAGGGALLLTSDLVARDLLPGLDARQRRLAGRITLAVVYGLVALLATLGPLAAAIMASVAVSLSAQILPATLGLCWVPWLSRGAILSGLVIGSILVLFTEPFGLVLFEGLFLDLPWGRWPLTVHSAAWGLVFNVAACLLVAIFTRGGEERLHRDRLHDMFRRDLRADFGGGAGRAARWSLTLIWAFLALGPGAILGNSFFSRPIFTQDEAPLGLPSLWVWQILAWLSGVLLVWWLAYQTRLSILDQPVRHRIDLSPPAPVIDGRRAPRWIAQTLARLTER